METTKKICTKGVPGKKNNAMVTKKKKINKYK